MIQYSKYLTKVIAAAKQHGVEVCFTSEMPQSPRPTIVRGAFRMGEALLSRKRSKEEALFIALHALGHMAQWSLFPEEHARSYFFTNRSDAWGEERLREIWDHEWGSLPFVLGFLRKHELEELRDWYVEYFIADQYYLAEIFKANEYGVEKFRTQLKKWEGKDIQFTLQARAYPLLDFAKKKESFICFL